MVGKGREAMQTKRRGMRNKYISLEKRVDAIESKHRRISQELTNLRFQLEQTEEFRAMKEMVMEIEPRIRRWFKLKEGWQPMRIQLGPLYDNDDEWYLHIQVSDSRTWVSIPQSRFSAKIWNRCQSQLARISEMPWFEPEPLFQRVMKSPGRESKVLEMPRRS